MTEQLGGPKRWTNAAEVARLAGLSRRMVGLYLAMDAMPGAVRVDIGARRAWRIPLASAAKWLKSRGVTGLVWRKREGVVGAMDDIWVAS